MLMSNHEKLPNQRYNHQAKPSQARVSLLIDTGYRHKIVAKRGAAFTIMVMYYRIRHQFSRANVFKVAGESGLGKTTFINTLFSTTIKNYADHRRRHAKQVDKTVEIEITKAELEEKFFKGTGILQLSGTEGLGANSFDSPLDRHRHSWIRRLREQPRLMDANH